LGAPLYPDEDPFIRDTPPYIPPPGEKRGKNPFWNIRKKNRSSADPQGEKNPLRENPFGKGKME